jgi:tetratricopeptide (TPR) repeat protein
VRGAVLRRWPAALLVCAALGLAPLRVGATPSEPDADPRIDVAPCVAAAAAGDADRIIAVCGELIDNEATPKPERVTALVARAAAFGGKDQLDRALADYDAVLGLDATRADAFTARGELRRRKGDRRGALADFTAALKRDPEQAAARASQRALVQELERHGALMAVTGRPSFDCATAKRAVERAICADPELVRLDREIAAGHARQLRAATRPELAARRREQADYLARRNAGFGRPGFDLRQLMAERLKQLTGSAAP